MKYFTNLISTTFYKEIQTDKNVMEIAEFIIQTYAYKVKKKLNNKITFRPYWLSFITNHPNLYITSSIFKYDKENQAIEFKIWHPFHLILSIIILLFILQESNSLIFLIAPIILCYFLVYSILCQRMIVKRIIKEIEK